MVNAAERGEVETGRLLPTYNLTGRARAANLEGVELLDGDPEEVYEDCCTDGSCNPQ